VVVDFFPCGGDLYFSDLVVGKLMLDDWWWSFIYLYLAAVVL